MVCPPHFRWWNPLWFIKFAHKRSLLSPGASSLKESLWLNYELFSLYPKAAAERHMGKEASQGRFGNLAAKNQGLHSNFWIKISPWEREHHMAVWWCSLLRISRISKDQLAQKVITSWQAVPGCALRESVCTGDAAPWQRICFVLHWRIIDSYFSEATVWKIRT